MFLYTFILPYTEHKFYIMLCIHEEIKNSAPYHQGGFVKIEHIFAQLMDKTTLSWGSTGVKAATGMFP